MGSEGGRRKVRPDGVTVSVKAWVVTPDFPETESVTLYAPVRSVDLGIPAMVPELLRLLVRATPVGRPEARILGSG